MQVRIYGSEGVLSLDLERDTIELAREGMDDEAIPLEDGALRYDGRRPVEAFCDLALGRSNTNLGDPLPSAYGIAVIERALAAARDGRVKRIVTRHADGTPPHVR
jgi:hypothetical protein